MVMSQTQIGLIQRLLINMGSVIQDPVVKTFVTHLLGELNEVELDNLIASVNTEHSLLVMPVQLNNFARRHMSAMLCDVIKNYMCFVRDNNKVPPTIHQAFVNASHTSMDYRKLEILHTFAMEWV